MTDKEQKQKLSVARALNPLRSSGHFFADALYAACVGAAVGMAGALLWGALG